MPGVVAVGAGNMAPFATSTYIMGFRLPERLTGGKPQLARALEYVVTPGYAEALRLRLREGRFFTDADVGAPISPMIVNGEFARRYLSSGPVVGRRFATDRDAISEVVGVVGNVLKDGLDAPPQPEIYDVEQPGRAIRGEINLVVRTAGDPLSLAPALRGLVREVDRDAAVDQVTTLGRRVSASVAEPRFAAAVLAGFAALAAVLAGVGLYGVLSYGVSQRRREFGLRAALGADRRNLVGLVLRQGLGLTAAGLALGLAGAAALARFLTKLLFGVTPHDALAFAVAPALLLVVAVAACLLPARRAAAVDPAEALRAE